MDARIQRRNARQRRWLQPFALFVVLMTMVGVLPGGLTDAAAQNTQDSETVGGQEAGAATTYLEVHLAQCPPDFEGGSGGDYYNACHSTPIEGIEVQLSSASGESVSQVSAQAEQDGPGVVRFEDLQPGEYQFTVNYAENPVNPYYTYCSLADADDEVPVEPNNADNGTLTIPDGEAVVCDWYVIAADSELESSTIDLTGYTCETGLFDPGSNPSWEELSSQCTTPAAGTNFTQQDPETEQGATVALDGDGQTTLSFDPARGADIFAEVRLADDEWMFCATDEDPQASPVSFNDDGVWEIAPGDAVTLTCTWFFSDVPDATAEPTEEPTEEPTVAPTEEPTVAPTEEPTEEVTVEPSDEDVTVEASANEDEGTTEPAEEVGGQEGPSGSISVLPMSCPQDFDPATGLDYDTLVANCQEPLANVSFNLNGPNGSTETLISDGSTPLVWDGLRGTYDLYSDIPLEAANEYSFCRQDGGNLYQREFNDVGVTTFENLQTENIVCEWFVVPEDLRGEETGASLEVHYAQCPSGYTGDTIFDDCHSNGVAGKTVYLTNAAGDEVTSSTVVEQEDGPGIARFTGLAGGTYTLTFDDDADTKVKAFCNTQPDDEAVEVSINNASGQFEIGQNEHVLCDWYVIPEGSQTTPTPTPTTERAEIIVTLYACPAANNGYAGATLGDFQNACDEKVNDVEFKLGDVGAPPITSTTGKYADGTLRFWDLLPGNFLLTPALPDNLSSAAVFCSIDEGDPYQKALSNGATRFEDINGESITCEWYAVEESDQQPTQPSGSVTIRQRLCEGENITDYDKQCVAGASGTSFTLTSSDGSITKEGTPNAQGVYVFSNLPDGFYSIKQNTGTWCKAVADRVDSRSRVIVEGGTNTDVVFYQCGDVTRLPTTGTGPAGTVEGDDLPLISASMWAVILGLLSIPFAALAIMQTVRARRQVQEVETPPTPGPVMLENGRLRMRYR